MPVRQDGIPVRHGTHQVGKLSQGGRPSSISVAAGQSCGPRLYSRAMSERHPHARLQCRQSGWLALLATPAPAGLWASCGFFEAAQWQHAQIAADDPTMSCAYTDLPASQPHALVRVSALGIVRLMPGHACIDLIKPMAGVVVTSWFEMINDRSLHGKRQGMAGTAPLNHRSAEVRVPAARPATVVFDSAEDLPGSYRHTCRTASSLVRPEGAQALLLAEPEWRGWPLSCRLSLRSLDATPVPALADAPPTCVAAPALTMPSAL